MKFWLHLPAWLSAAQLPLHAAVLAYVGAGGLAGAAVVAGVMLTPAREVVQEAVAPVGQFVESVMPMSVPSFLPTDPRQAVAPLPIGKARAASSVSPTAVPAPVTVDDFLVEEGVAEATPTPQALLIAPRRTVPTPQNALQPAPEPEIGLPVQGGPSPIGLVTVGPPIPAIDHTSPSTAGRPAAAAAVEVRTGSRAEAEADARARATGAPLSPRNALSGSTVDNQRAATVAPPTAIVVHATTGRTSEPSPTAQAVPTPRPTSVPPEAPTPAPTVAPTQAPTVPATLAPTVAATQAPTLEPTRVPTQAPTQEPPKKAAPTQEPKKTAVPTQEPKKTAEPTRVPQRPAKATPVPTRAAPTATPVKEKEKEKEKEKRPTTTPTRRDHDDHGDHTGGDGQPPTDHQGD